CSAGQSAGDAEGKPCRTARDSKSTINGGSCFGGRLPDPRKSRSWTTIEKGWQMAKKLPAIHPGEVLRDEFLGPMELTPYAVAKAIGVPRTRIERLAREETPVTADTALRL